MKLEITPEYRRDAVAYLNAQTKVERHFNRLRNKLRAAPLPDDEFFKWLDVFRKEIGHFLDRKYHPASAVKSGAEEFFRQALGYGEHDDLDYPTAMRFLITYDAMKSRIGRAIGPVYECGGDSFDDLCDSIPLGGQTLIERCLKTTGKNRDGFLSTREIDEAIKTLPEKLGKLVGDEVYAEMSLTDAAQERIFSWMRHNVFDAEDGEAIRKVEDE